MKRSIISVAAVSAFLMVAVWSLPAGAEVFTVSNDGDLTTALNTARSNGQADTININGGVYGSGGYNFQYAPSGENFPLTLSGAGAGMTVFEGGALPVLSLMTYSFDDANVVITIEGITFRNGNTGTSGSCLAFGTGKGSVNITNCSFLNNISGGSGGALSIYSNYGGSVSLIGNLFQGNQSAGAGGGAYIIVNDRPGSVLLEGNTFRENSSTWGGGAYLSTQGNGLGINNNRFFDNTASTTSGGGIFAQGLSIYTVGTFSGNLFIDNTAATDGGGTCLAAFGLTAANNLFAHNSATGGNGGGAWFYTYSEPFRFINNTLTENDCSGSGGGFYLDYASPDIYNNIFWQNSATSSGDDFFMGSYAASGDVYNNDVADFVCSSYCANGDNMSLDPMFTGTSDPDPVNWNLSLKTASPCINKGTASAPSLPSVDIEGNPRSVGPAPDLGAYESGIILFDNFSDAAATAAKWVKELGTWRVVTLPTGNNVCRSGSSGSSVLLAKDLTLNAARFSARFKIGATTALPYASLIFNTLSGTAYREVKLYQTATGLWKMAILQKGAYDSDTAGTKAMRTLLNFRPASWHTLTLDILADGNVSARLDTRTPLTTTFGGNTGGGIGLRSIKTSVSFDDVTVSQP